MKCTGWVLKNSHVVIIHTCFTNDKHFDKQQIYICKNLHFKRRNDLKCSSHFKRHQQFEICRRITDEHHKETHLEKELNHINIHILPKDDKGGKEIFSLLWALFAFIR